MPEHRETRSTTSLLKTAIPVAALVLVCGAIYLYKAGLPFTYDQPVARIIMAQREPLAIIFDNIDGRHPPLSLFILHYSTLIFGMGERAAIYPNVLFSILAVVAFFFLVSEYTDRFTGFTAGIIMGIWPAFVKEAREVSNFPHFTFFTILSSMYFLRIIRAARDKEEIRRRDILGYAISTVLLASSNYFFVFVIGGQVLCLIYTMVKGNKLPRRALIYLVATQILCIPSYIGLIAGYLGDLPLVHTASVSPGLSWVGRSQLMFVKELGEYYFGESRGIGVWQLRSIQGFLLFVSLHYLFTHTREDGRSIPVVSYLVPMIVLTLVVNLVFLSSARLKPYYVIFLMPALLFMFFYGLSSLCRNIEITDKYREYVLPGLMIVLVGAQAFFYYHQTHWLYVPQNNMTIKHVVTYIEDHNADSEPVLFENHNIAWLVLYYAFNDPRGYTRHRANILNSGNDRFESPPREPYYANIITMKRYHTEEEMDQVALEILGKYARPYWFITHARDTLPVIRSIMNEECKSEFINDEYELFHCEKYTKN